jgi:transcriptional regulator with XRE-family HTH domain
VIVISYNQIVNSDIKDFSWAELGQRIRHFRVAARMTQQELAGLANVTQNAIWRIEAGETNPQLPTLTGIASALGTTVRELLAGQEAVASELSPWVGRIKKVIASGDEAAIQAMQNGLENAELLLARGKRRGLPRLVVKGEDQAPNNLFWSQLPIRRRSVTGQNSPRSSGKNTTSKEVRKAR